MNTEPHRTSRPRVDIVTPVYNEEAGLPQYVEAVARTLLDHPDYDVHVLFIDDGSVDSSWQYIALLCQRDPRFRGIRLSRNYGSHLALTAGFAHADGDAVATLACDLQDPPEVVLEFLECWRRGARIVWGRRATRDDEWWRVIASRLFESALRRRGLPKNSRFTVGSFLLIDRSVVDCLQQFPEQNRVTFALVAWTGFSQDVVDYHRRRRQTGVSGWSSRQMFKTMYDAFIGFSPVPIRLITVAGLGAFLASFGFAAYLVIVWLTGRPSLGWTSTMLAMSFFFGVQMLLMGLMGEYLYRIYAEVVRRPLYLVTAVTPAAEPEGTIRSADV